VLTRGSGAWEVWHPARVRPLAYFTLWANYQAGGAAPFGYHLVNWLLHLASVALCAYALRPLLPGPGALIAGGLFALHPLQTESVAYVFARSTLLCGFFCLAALAFWTRGRHWPAVAMHALALLAKEEAVALPIVFALLHFSISRNAREWRAIGVMLLLALAVGARGLFITATQGGTGAVASAGIAPLDYLATQSFVLARYAWHTVVPIGLNFDPDIALMNDGRGWSLWLIWLGIVAYAIRHFTRARAGLWILAALAILAPTSSILPIADLSADRRMYLALAAIGAAIAPRIPVRAAIAVGAVLAALTFLRAFSWQTEESLWRDTVAKSPGKLRPLLQLSRAVSPEEAIQLLQARPEPAAAAERGRAYMMRQRPADALREFGQVLAENPNDPGALTNRGAALAALGQSEAARADFERALAQDPCFAPALQNLQRPTPSRCP